MPFQPFSVTLKTALLEDFLSKMANWLFGTESDRLLAQVSNSPWEASLSIIFLLKFSDLIRGETLRAKSPTIDNIERKAKSLSEWLCSHAQHESGEEISWEHVTWDSATVLRALFHIRARFSASLPASTLRAIDTATGKGLRWLLGTFAHWHTTIKYPFGPADVASIALCLAEGFRLCPEPLEAACRDLSGGKVSAREFCLGLLREISEYLLLQAAVPRGSWEGETLRFDVPCTWDDFFTTSEALEAIGEYYHFATTSEKELQNSHREMLDRVRTCLLSAQTYYELSQVDGMWGSHIDTIKCLYVYVKIPRYITLSARSDALTTTELHIAFKALRWICDEKQFFQDGSILHTMFLTVFASQTLLEVAQYWPPVDRRIDDLYDDVVWASPVRVSFHKLERTRVALQLEKVERARDAERHTLLGVLGERTISLYFRDAIVQTFLWASVSAAVCLAAAIGLGMIDVSKVAIRSVGDLMGFAGVCATVLVSGIGLIWAGWYRRRERAREAAEVPRLEDAESN
jgi:hypothetical protein